jgi:hypothetical protein
VRLRYKKIILRLRVSKENLYDLGLYLSIIFGWIGYIFWPEHFENRCNEFLYIFVFGVVISFFSIIPIYYEYDVRKEKAFKSYLPGSGLTSGTTLIFLPSFIFTISTFIDIIDNHCITYWLLNNYLYSTVLFFSFFVFLFTIYLLIKFFLKAIDHIFNK